MSLVQKLWRVGKKLYVNIHIIKFLIAVNPSILYKNNFYILLIFQLKGVWGREMPQELIVPATFPED